MVYPEMATNKHRKRLHAINEDLPLMTGEAPTEPKKRISLACDPCRSKRTKCDGDEQCSACLRRGEFCHYNPEGSRRKRTSNAYIQALEARVEGLEKMLNLRRDSIPAPLQSVPSKSSDVDDITDTLGCFTLGDAGELRFFGTSSNFSIIRNHTLRVASSLEARQRGMEAAQKMHDWVEASTETRDHLLELYWKWQNSWQYIVSRESFVDDLYVHRSGKFCTPLLLNAILAYASRYSDRPELRSDPDNANTAGDAFANQAKTMLHYECEAPTTSTVQAAGLLGLYWASIDREGLGFMYIGMASRMAMNLGLHSDCSAYVQQGLISHEDAEARKIAFWGIYVLDKLYCLGMGRPAAIQEYNITTAKSSIEDRSTCSLSAALDTISNPWPTSHITENAMQMCEIFMITSAVIDQLYAQRPAWEEQEKYERIMDTHVRLVKWHENLPKGLRISESSLQPSPPYVYQLHFQYHVSLILLHRPYFKLLYDSPSSGDYDPSCGDIHSQSCHNAAIKIASIFRIFRQNYSNRCMPISAVHPALTAAIIHLLELKTADPAGQSKAARHLRICLTSLYEMNCNWDWANRSIRAIQSLAVQWSVDCWLPGLLKDVPEANAAQFDRYQQSCIVAADIPTSNSFPPIDQTDPYGPFEDTFDSWVHSGMHDSVLDSLGWNWQDNAVLGF